MKEKIKCPNCKLLIDNDLETCPYCGFKIDKEEINKKDNENSIEYVKIKDQNENKENKTKIKSFIKFESRSINLKHKNLILFLVGFLLLQILGSILQVYALIKNQYFLYTDGIAYINFSMYFMICGILFLIINQDVLNIFNKFNKLRTYLMGFSYGFLLIIISTLLSNLINLATNNGSSSNDNQNNVESIVKLFPYLSIIVFGIIGPLVEEITYRLGFFTLIAKKSRLLAYILTGLLFGLIHFNFTSSNLVNELINLPPYIVSGLLLSYYYDKEGLEVSFIAHATNNLVSIILSILL